MLHEGALRGRFDSANDDVVSYFTGSGGSGGAETARLGIGLLGSSVWGGAPATALTTSSAGGGVGEGGDTDAAGGGNGDVGSSEPATEGFGEQSQEEFLVAVKRRLKIETPLDKTFWRPYARLSSEGRATIPAGGNRTNLIFVAGAEGTGHHFVRRGTRRGFLWGGEWVWEGAVVAPIPRRRSPAPTRPQLRAGAAADGRGWCGRAM
jgi:hypothetical protein